MTALSTLLHKYATGRTVVSGVIFAGLVYLIQSAILVPYFRAVTGFVPFDLQFPLTRYMMAIQLGAYDSRAPAAYLPFVVTDTVLNALTTTVLMLLWTWLFHAQPNRVFDFFQRGAVMLVPVYALLCDMAENLAFSALIGGLSGEQAILALRVGVVAHNVRGAFLDLQMIFTLVFVILFALVAVRRHGTLRVGDS